MHRMHFERGGRSRGSIFVTGSSTILRADPRMGRGTQVASRSRVHRRLDPAMPAATSANKPLRFACARSLQREAEARRAASRVSMPRVGVCQRATRPTITTFWVIGTKPANSSRKTLPRAFARCGVKVDPRDEELAGFSRPAPPTLRVRVAAAWARLGYRLTHLQQHCSRC